MMQEKQLLRSGAARLGIGQAMAEAKPSTSILKNRKAAIVNIKADHKNFQMDQQNKI
jgi:hypothetical protein